MFWKTKKTDPELLEISRRMDEIKDSNRKAVDELIELNRTLREMRRNVEKELKRINRA